MDGLKDERNQTIDALHTSASTSAPNVVVSVTQRAAHKAMALAKNHKVPPSLRLGVKGGGCSGFSYFYEFDINEKAGDAVWTVGGLTVRCDPKSAKILSGCVLDYDGHLLRGGFRFSNPRAKTSCSCGESFTL